MEQEVEGSSTNCVLFKCYLWSMQTWLLFFSIAQLSETQSFSGNGGENPETTRDSTGKSESSFVDGTCSFLVARLFSINTWHCVSFRVNHGVYTC